MKNKRKPSSNFIIKQVKTETNQGKKALLTEFLVSFAALGSFSVSVSGFLNSVFRWGIRTEPLFAAELFLAAVFAAVCLAPKKKRYIAWGILAGAVLLCAVLFRNDLRSGVNILLNRSIERIGTLYPYHFPYFECNLTEEAQSMAASLAVTFFSILFLLLAYYLLQSANRFLIAVLVAAGLLFQAVSGLFGSVFWNICALLSSLLLWQTAQGKSDNRIPVSAPETTALASIGVLVLAAAGSLLMPQTDWNGVDAFTGLRTKIERSVEKLQYEGTAEVLPDGRLADADGFSPNGDAALTVTMSTPASYYLRGFVGAKLVDNEWQSSDEEKLWSGRSTFYDLHSQGFYGQEQLSLSALALDASVSEEDENTIKIENTGADRKYLYTPYEIKDSVSQLISESQKVGDEEVRSGGWSGQTEYTYSSLSPQVTHFPTLAAAMLDEVNLSEEGLVYRAQEGEYNTFVYEMYSAVPEELSGTLYSLLGDYEHISGEKHAAYTEAKQNILYLLTKKYQYSETIEKAPSDSNLLKDFLLNSKTGYSVHFASAAVCMFRYYGIPARYVEGYLVTPEDAAQMKAGEPYTIDNTHAHAWAEYYQDGVGWLPFEITPAYLNTMERTENYQDISGVSGISDEDPEEEITSEDEKEPENESFFDWILFLEILLGIVIGLLLIRLLMLLFWVIRERAETKRMKEQFNDPDMRTAVTALFTYIMNILAVSGLHISNVSLYSYEEQVKVMFDEGLAGEYLQAVESRQKAVYSNNEVRKEEQEQLTRLKDELWKRVFENGSLSQKLMLKYVFYL